MAIFFFLLLLFISFVSPAVSQTSLTLNERIQAQEKIERIYYNHRISPETNKSLKPPFEEMVPRSVIEKKVNDSLSVRITPAMLQAEMDRIGKTTKDPAMLQELFSALNSDPFLIAETLVRSSLADRMIHGNNFVPSKRRIKKFRLPEVNTNSSCGGWDVLDASDPPPPQFLYTSIWTGTEMIVWGGDCTGARYDPALNTWTPISTGPNCPSGAGNPVWSGSEMIVWGAADSSGGRYNPTSDSWLPTSFINAPEPRSGYTSVWTGSEMIVWGGQTGKFDQLNSGGRYDPSTDSWQPISIGMNLPEPRSYHSAVWTGQEMIIWGGRSGVVPLNSGGKYNPVSDSWLPTSLAPVGQNNHTAVWTGTQMIVWGGETGLNAADTTNTGAIYSPATDLWQKTSLVGAAIERTGHTAVWTGTEMIVWGGFAELMQLFVDIRSGGRYSPASDTWLGTAIGSNTPTGRLLHTAVWTGTKMIIFGGYQEGSSTCFSLTPPQLNGIGDTGGIYTPEADNIVLDPPMLPNPEAGVPYSETVSASGGASPYTMALVEGCLPHGLTLDESSGVISGVPDLANGNDTVFAITATDANSCPGSRSYTVHICPEMIFSPPSLPAGMLGLPYNQTISITLTFPLFAITAGALPDGLLLDESTGVISGKPTALGTFNFTITASSGGCMKSKDYTIKITLATHN